MPRGASSPAVKNLCENGTSWQYHVTGSADFSDHVTQSADFCDHVTQPAVNGQPYSYGCQLQAGFFKLNFLNWPSSVFIEMKNVH